MGSGSSRRRGAAAAARAAVPVGKAPERREPLQTALAEGEEAAALPTPGRRAPAAAGTPPLRDGGSCGDAAAGGGGGALLPQAALSTRSPMSPENNNADHQCPQENSKKTAGQSTISYDYSEEELMASIEREYCR
ncbi:cystin-1 isoform X1 [Pezoporus flaviventris]|uniref:cystin-1 isoform X1 n=1 Tax=Pezoporus flaviventris TaxID=889875 RepID=UPI002AAFEBF8|nr:cystin-1 isoform X1 [Pezoporus flaviventris]